MSRESYKCLSGHCKVDDKSIRLQALPMSGIVVVTVVVVVVFAVVILGVAPVESSLVVSFGPIVVLEPVTLVPIFVRLHSLEMVVPI